MNRGFHIVVRTGIGWIDLDCLAIVFECFFAQAHYFVKVTSIGVHIGCFIPVLLILIFSLNFGLLSSTGSGVFSATLPH